MTHAVRNAGRATRQLESLMETLVGLGLLVAINVVFFPEDPGYLTVNPHPFLFLTILVASRYGTFDGFVTGLLCAGVYAMYVFFGKDFATVARTFEWQQMIPAYLFLILGLLLGEIREMANKDVSKASREIRSHQDRIATLSRDNELLTRVKEELQHRILSAEDPLAQFYESARKLSTLRPDEAYPALMELIARFTGAEKFGLYLLDTGTPVLPGRKAVRTFRLKLQRGWARPDEFDTVLTDENGAVARALQSGEVVTLRDLGDAPQADIVACTAMTDPSDGTAVGLLVLHRIAFVRLTQLTLSHLHTIAGWAGKTLADAKRFDSAMGARIDDEHTGLYNFKYLSQRLAEEAARVKRYGGACTFMLVKVLDAETLTPDDRRAFMKEMAATLTALLRNVDVVGMYRMPGVFGVILPETGPSQSVVVTARVNEAFRRAFGGYGSRFAHLRLRMGLSGTRVNEPLDEAKMMEEAERFELGRTRAG